MALLALLACAPGSVSNGTAVGNPTDMSVQLADAKDLTLLQATATLATVTVLGCEGEDAVAAVGASVDLLSPNSVPIPSGTWCGVTLELSSPLHLAGETDDAEAFSLDVPVPLVSTGETEPWHSEDGPFVLGIGKDGWLVERDLDRADIETELAEELSQCVRLYHDNDADGALGPGDSRAGADDDDGQGKSQSED